MYCFHNILGGGSYSLSAQSSERKADYVCIRSLSFGFYFSNFQTTPHSFYKFLKVCNNSPVSARQKKEEVETILSSVIFWKCYFFNFKNKIFRKVCECDQALVKFYQFYGKEISSLECRGIRNSLCEQNYWGNQ